MPGRPVSDLNLPHFLKTALAENGYATLEDLSVSAAELAVELSIGVPQAEDILRQAASFRAGPSRPTSRPTSRPPSQPPSLPTTPASAVPRSQLHSSTARELLSSPSTRFSTLSGGLDALFSHFSPALHAGVVPPLNVKGKARALDPHLSPLAPGMVVELSGPPGVGKSCVALGVAMSARLREVEVLVIDTEGSLTSDRARAAADALLVSLDAQTTSTDVLAGIHLVRVATQVQMVAVLHTLDGWLASHPKVKLVIIDTLSYHFRQPGLDLGARRRAMDLAKQVIGKAATVHGCCVVVANQLATKLLTAENKPAKFETGDRAVLMPMLGDAWTTERTVRVALFRGGPGDDLRYAHASTASLPPSQGDVPWASFDIDSDGLPCDVPPIVEDEDELV